MTLWPKRHRAFFISPNELQYAHETRTVQPCREATGLPNDGHDCHECTHQIIAALLPQVQAPRPPVDILTDAEEIAGESDHFSHAVIGHTVSGRPIDCFSCGDGNRSALFYGFPDPGEAVAASVILLLMRSLGSENLLRTFDLRWHFIPCINFDDQPDSGRGLGPVFRDPRRKEVDWCIDAPRPETEALLRVAQDHCPVFIFPGHDEIHSREDIPAYFGVAGRLSPDCAERIRRHFASLGIIIDANYSHETLGAGFFNMAKIEDSSKSTFSRFAKTGTVFVAEVAAWPGKAETTPVSAQLAAVLLALDDVLSRDVPT